MRSRAGMWGGLVARPLVPRKLVSRTLVALALIATLAACGAGDTTPPDVTPDPQTATVQEGRFRLAFTVDRTTLKPGDNITGTAELSLVAPGSGILSGSSDLFGFEFVEVGGQQRAVFPTYPADCSPHQVGSDSPLTSRILKMGAFDESNPGFVGEFMRRDGIHLPAGQWDLTAIAGFYEGRGCEGPAHTLRATVRVTVNP